MSHDIHHKHLIKELREQLAPLFEQSPQAIYLYLDDAHKICSQKFADLLEYGSVEEWVANEHPVGDVDEADRDKVIDAYAEASGDLRASTLPAIWVTKKGKKVKTEVTMVPLPYRNEIFVLHFIVVKK